MTNVINLPLRPELALPPLLDNDPADALTPRKDYAIWPLPEGYLNIKDVMFTLLSKRGLKQADITGFVSELYTDLPPNKIAALDRANRAAFSGALLLKDGKMQSEIPEDGDLLVYSQGDVIDVSS